MKALKMAGIPALLAICVIMAVGQDATHDVDKAVTTTGHIVKHAAKKASKGTKTGVKDIGHETKVATKDAGKGVKTGTVKTGEGIKDAVSK